MTTTDPLLALRDKLLGGGLKTIEEIEALGQLQQLAAFLAQRHLELRQTLASVNLAAAPGQYVRLSGAQEFGMELYWASEWAANPPAWFQAWLNESLANRAAFDVLTFLLKFYEHEKMSKAEFDQLMQWAVSPGLVGNDGTIYGFAKYEQLDEGWMIAALNYVINIARPGDIVPFPTPALSVVPMSARSGSGDPVLGIIGDWGGGAYSEQGAGGRPVPSPAQRVLAAVKQERLDYLFHLGDTYYAGTAASRLGKDSANEEQDNLVDLWPDQGPGRNYTLNSNHEMYGAGQGYFGVALKQSGLFPQQVGASYFALSYPLQQAGQSWLVLGLDSAYYSDKENGTKMYMDGAIGSKKFLDDHEQQMRAVAQLVRGHAGPIMVMTHHNPCDTITAQTNVLYDQVVGVIGRAPTLWIWGHVHNCIVYDQMIVQSGQGPSIVSPTKSRCCGHAAIPFGPAWGLANADLPYVAETHDDLFPADNPRVCNGYGLVTLHRDGGFTESYYEVRKPGQPGALAWSKRWAAGELAATCADA